MLGIYLASFFCLLGVFAIVQGRFVLRLKSNHRDLWIQLGKPKPLMGFDRFPQWATNLDAYLRLRQYLSTDDLTLHLMGDRTLRFRQLPLRFGLIGGGIMAAVMLVAHHYDP
ncbi:MAG TPA: hypothetical protein VK700_11380 [Steroidobacteraceae bacterium]|jgi:hypothetical protein|nr:hypothetical protein [Steroidobacteraceae bacterium]